MKEKYGDEERKPFIGDGGGGFHSFITHSLTHATAKAIDVSLKKVARLLCRNLMALSCLLWESAHSTPLRLSYLDGKSKKEGRKDIYGRVATAKQSKASGDFRPFLPPSFGGPIRSFREKTRYIAAAAGLNLDTTHTRGSSEDWRIGGGGWRLLRCTFTAQSVWK